MKKYYPIMIDLEKRNCIVIGGGRVAYGKVLSLLEYGAFVTIISERVLEPFHKLIQQKKVHWIQRNYKKGDLEKAYFVYVATNDSEENKMAYAEAHEKNILVNVVDVPSLCDFIVPSKIQQGDLTIAVSTNGKSPMLARKIREDLEKQFGYEYESFLDLMGELRKKVLEEIPEIQNRTKIYEQIVYSDFLERLKREKKESIKDEMIEVLKSYKEMKEGQK